MGLPAVITRCHVTLTVKIISTLIYSVGEHIRLVHLDGGTMARSEHEPITAVWGQSLQRGPGAEPLVRGAKPPEAESILVIGCPTEPANLAPFQFTSGNELSVDLLALRKTSAYN